MVIALSGYNAYFDRSADAPRADEKTVVAGYVSSVEQWAQWEINWKLALASFDVPYFHMKNFVACSRPFDHPKWKAESYRAQFLSRLIAITCEWAAASIAVLINQKTFDNANRFYELDKHLNPYAICGKDCGIKTRNFIRNEYKSDLPIAYFFEKGDPEPGKLIGILDKAGLPAPVFKRPRPDSKKDKDDPPAIQLQACDLVAWEVRRGDHDFKLKGKLRKSLNAIGAIKHFWGECKEQGLNDLIRDAGIPLRKEWSFVPDIPRKPSAS
jgi:hypothetical protein